jgi:hypothetical protein
MRLREGVNSKVCVNCKELKLFAEFHTDNASSDKLKRRCKQCRCVAERRRKDTKRTFISSFKDSCQKCDDGRSYVLTFHHLEPANKKFNLSDGRHYTKEAILKEIEKCVVLCANCHQEFHYHERNFGTLIEEYLEDEFEAQDDAL